MNLFKNKIAVIYARFSAEDTALGIGERTIENQIDILTKYANNNGFKLVKVYSDVGKTGTNMNRPGLIELFDDMEKGLFNVIIVKDLSRFSRNYIDSGTYIDEVFPRKRIRFISVSDNFDSAKPEDDFVVLRNFLNTMYVKDLKKKVKKSLSRRIVKEDITGIIKYGFMRDEKGKLIIDPYASNIVKKIFKMAIEGKKPIEIVKCLEKIKIYNPSTYKERVLKVKTNKHSDNPYKWDRGYIRRMLKDYEYAGYAVNVVSKSRIFDETSIMIKDKRPVIIDEETFNMVPKVFKVVKKNEASNYLPKLIYCNTCGKLMIYHEDKRLCKTIYYCCKCHTKIDGNALKDILYEDALNVLKVSTLNPKEFLEELKKRYSINKERDIFEAKQKELEVAMKTLFEEKIKDSITNDQYQKGMKSLNEEYEVIENKLKKEKNPIDVKLLEYKYYEFVNKLDSKFSNKEELIKRIIKMVAVEVQKKVKPKINIQYHFQ